MKSPVKIISSQQPGLREYVKSLWAYRSLIRVLAVRDIKIKYSQTFLGIIWAVVQPLIAVFIYSVFFYIILEMRTDPVPYPLFVIPGVLCWFHFTRIIYDTGNVLNENQDLIHKIEFPRLALVISKVLSGLLEVLITLALLFVVMVVIGYPFKWKMLVFPVFLMMNVLAGLSISVWLVALTIRYRDLYHIIPYLVSFGIWLTPVFYPTTVLPPRLEGYIYLNPVAGVLSGYRWSLIDYGVFSWKYLPAIAVMLVMFILGVFYFIKEESRVSDYV